MRPAGGAMRHVGRTMQDVQGGMQDAGCRMQDDSTTLHPAARVAHRASCIPHPMRLWGRKFSPEHSIGARKTVSWPAFGCRTGLGEWTEKLSGDLDWVLRFSALVVSGDSNLKEP